MEEQVLDQEQETVLDREWVVPVQVGDEERDPQREMMGDWCGASATSEENPPVTLQSLAKLMAEIEESAAGMKAYIQETRDQLLDAQMVVSCPVGRVVHWPRPEEPSPYRVHWDRIGYPTYYGTCTPSRNQVSGRQYARSSGPQVIAWTPNMKLPGLMSSAPLDATQADQLTEPDGTVVRRYWTAEGVHLLEQRYVPVP